MRWLLTGIGLEQRRLRLGWELREAIARRVVGLWTRMQRVFARLRAGTLGPPRLRASRARAAAEESAPQPERPPRAPRLLPREFGWLKRLMPQAAHCMNPFISLLADAEMEAIVASAPQVGRILRPFCHILGLPLPDYLKLPKRPRRPRPPPRPTSAARGRGKVRPPKPIDVTKLSSVAYGHFLRTRNTRWASARRTGSATPARAGPRKTGSEAGRQKCAQIVTK